MFAYCLNNPIIFVDRTGAMVCAATITAAGASVASLGPVGIAIAIVLVVVVIVATAPPVHKTLSVSTAATTIPATELTDEWLGNQKKGIEKKLIASLAKANPQKSNNNHVHHIVAQTDRRATPARYILSLINLSVNSTINLVLVKDTVHRRLHTNWYYNTVNHMIMDAYLAAGLDKAMQFKKVTDVLMSLQVYINTLNALAP